MMRNGDTPNEITCLVEGRNVVGESPLWHPEHDAIYWTDVNGFLIQSYRIGDSEVTVWRFDEPVCARRSGALGPVRARRVLVGFPASRSPGARSSLVLANVGSPLGFEWAGREGFVLELPLLARGAEHQRAAAHVAKAFELGREEQTLAEHFL